MNRKRIPSLLAMFFLVQGLILPQTSPAENCNLNPLNEVYIVESSFLIRPMLDGSAAFPALPDLNTILKECRIKPRNAFRDVETGSCI